MGALHRWCKIIIKGEGLGLAVRRQLEEARAILKRYVEIASVLRWLKHALDEDERLLIAQGTDPLIVDPFVDTHLTDESLTRRHASSHPDSVDNRREPDVPL
jgi:hypothetical protein